MATFKLVKSSDKSAVYASVDSGARLQIRMSAFEGAAPAELPVDAPNFAPASEKVKAKLERAAARAAKIVDLPAKIEKKRAQLAKLEALASSTQAAAPVAEQASV